MISKPQTEIELGTFEVSCGQLIVSDPCYSLDTWCQGILQNVKNGIWKGFVLRGTADWGDERVWEIFAYHEKHRTFPDAICEKQTFEVGVDSGQAGIFNKDDFHGGEDDYGDGGWYDECCKITLDAPDCAGTLTGGIVSSSGFGDGGYFCYVSKKDEEIVAVRIVFLGDEDEEDEWNDDEEYDEEE